MTNRIEFSKADVGNMIHILGRNAELVLLGGKASEAEKELILKAMSSISVIITGEGNFITNLIPQSAYLTS